MDTDRNLPPFLRLTAELRQRIYAYLLPKHPKEAVTTINYNLEWPLLDHPSSSTFTAHQLDICRCTHQQPDHTISATQENEHIYKRYLCQGPEVRISSRSQPLWILSQPGQSFNVLRPASNAELRRRPSAGIVHVNKLLYRETIPLLYGGRNFLLLTGICSRGRYQAYATQTWLSQLSSFARSHITALSLIVQKNEEDCRDADADKAFLFLSMFIVEKLPHFRNMCLNFWEPGLQIYPFAMLFRRPGTRIVLKEDSIDEEVYVFSNAQEFLLHCGGDSSDEEWLNLQWQDLHEDDEQDWELVSPRSAG